MSHKTCPYNDFSKQSFWHKEVKQRDGCLKGYKFESSFKIDKRTKISTAGSCFAQNLTYFLQNMDFNVLSYENVPKSIDTSLAKSYGFNSFSARYGNIYTSRQLLQLLQRSLEKFKPKEILWENLEGALFDPFRPSLNPKGYSNSHELEADRKQHLKSFKNLILKSEIFVFTLGLTEGWRSKIDGSFFPICPGCGYGKFSQEKYEFVNLSYDEIVNDIQEFINLSRSLNPELKFIFSVSPVPLIATASNEHVFVANNYSKSVLRVAAAEIASKNKFVEYFPSYEIITSGYDKFFEDDLRTVKFEGIEIVMDSFMSSFLKNSVKSKKLEKKNVVNIEKIFTEVICDEDNLIKGLTKQ